MKFAKKKAWIASSLIIFVLLVLITFYLINKYKQHTAIPSKIVKKAAFTILVTDEENYFIDKGSVKFDQAKGILSFNVIGNSRILNVTEQAVPDSFSDIPQLYPALLNKMHQYGEINTTAGTVALTKPQELNGGQTAVLRSNRGLLIFVRPDKNLSENEWRSFFNSLESI